MPGIARAERRLFQQRDCMANGSETGKRLALSGTEGTPVGLECGGQMGQRRQRQGSDREVGQWGLVAALLKCWRSFPQGP